MTFWRTIAIVAILLLVERPSGTEGLLKRCVSCRSRGDLGTCKDPFTKNATLIEKEKGVKADPCASGWCVKIIESLSINNEYGTATERSCLQRGPDDNEERCAYATWNYKKVYMCFCNGDLCNSATNLGHAPMLYATVTIVATLLSRRWLL